MTWIAETAQHFGKLAEQNHIQLTAEITRLRKLTRRLTITVYVALTGGTITWLALLHCMFT